MIFYELNVLFCSLKLKMSWFLGMVIKATKDQVRIKLFLKDKTKHSIFHMLKVGSCKSRQGTSTVQGYAEIQKFHFKHSRQHLCTVSLQSSVGMQLLKQPFYSSYAVKDCLLLNGNPSLSLPKLTSSDRDIHYPFILILKNLMINMWFFLCLIFNFVVYRLLRYVQQCQFRQRVINRHRGLQKVNPKLKSHALRPRHWTRRDTATGVPENCHPGVSIYSETQV